MYAWANEAAQPMSPTATSGRGERNRYVGVDWASDRSAFLSSMVRYFSLGFEAGNPPRSFRLEDMLWCWPVDHTGKNRRD